MRATLGNRISAGRTCLICTRCGWWAAYQEPYTLNIDAFPCPDCNAPLDGIVPPPRLLPSIGT